MPRRGGGSRLSIPTEHEFNAQLLEEREVVACSGSRFEPLSSPRAARLAAISARIRSGISIELFVRGGRQSG